MTFDWTISLGNLLTVAGFGFSGVIFVMMMRSDLMVLGQRIGTVEETLKEIAHTQFIIAEEKGKLHSLEERVEAISRRLDTYIIRPKE